MSGLTSDVYDEHLVDESSQYMLDDLQLAAELGKTLLERNKELEATLKHHQNIIEDHVQEIEYLTKQNAALREVNDSRMKIYEQLEVSIQDLERDKYKLALEYQAEKKHVKQLCSNIESLETKVEELTRSLEDARRQVEADRRTKKTERLLGQQQQQQQLPGQPAIVINSPTSHASKDAIPNVPSQEGVSTSRQTTEPCQSAKPMPAGAAKQSDPAAPSSAPGESRTEEDGVEQCERDGGPTADDHTLSEDSEEMLRIMQELERTQKCLLSEQGKVGDLEEQLAVIAQENTALQSKLLNVHSTEIRSVHDELSMLEEFRQGPVCTRCLRDLGEQQDEDSIITGTTEDDASLMELIRNTDFPQAYRSSVTIEIEPTKPDSLDLALSECAGPTNPYRELVEKYEALLEVHRQPIGQKSATAAPTGAPGPATGVAGSGNNTPVDSCQPQQLLADAAALLPCGPSTLGAGGDEAPERAGPGERRDGRAVAATECSETASSGYSDEVSNKATQTDESPRNFLCTIADGKDWRFNIYEDDSAIDSRFRFSPAHRELFREIFSVLRKAAENRDEGDQLPLLDDAKPGAANPPPAAARGGGGAAAVTVPPVTPANDEPPTGFGLEKDGQQGEGAVEQDDEVGETVSFVSSSAVSEQSFAMSECITKSERRRIARQAKAAGRYADGEQQAGNGADPAGQKPAGPGYIPLEYISVSVGVRKGKSRRRSHRRDEAHTPQGAAAGGGGAAPAATTTPTPPRSGSARKHRTSFRPWNPERDGGVAIAADAASWSASAGRGHRSATPLSNAGTTIATPPSAAAVQPGASRTSRRSEKKRNATSGLRNRYADLMQDALGDEVVEFRPSSASQHLHKLQKLDLSYAEVLRRADGGHPFPARRQYNQPQQQQQQ